MNHFYLNPKVKSNLGISFYEIKLKKIKLITKKNIDFKLYWFKSGALQNPT